MHSSKPNQLITLCLCCLLLLVHGSLDKPSQQSLQAKEDFQIHFLRQEPFPKAVRSQELPKQSLMEGELIDGVISSEEDPFSSISAKAYVVLDPQSGTVILSRNLFCPFYPASTVKLMTALVAVDLYSLDEVLSVVEGMNAVGNKVGFLWGAQLTVKDLLYALLLNSGNDAAQILAANHPDGYLGFVNEMNKKATELHLTQTNFTNPTGIDDYRQLTSAWDLSLLTREFLQNELLAEIVGTSAALVRDQMTGYPYQLYNTNQLLSSTDSVRGVKTGTTNLAQQVLITLSEDNSRIILIVLMGSQDRYAETTFLINWVKTNVVWDNGEGNLLE